MKKTILLLVFFCVALFGQEKDKSKIDLNQPIPADPTVKIGKLRNGLTYFIKKNIKPEKRAELRLVVKAGSINENDDQQGLAHFVEHMCFNGTENFKKQEIINYLESIGMKFGPEVNAYTGFEETVYMIQVPTDTPKIVQTGFQILEEWAHNVSFEDEEIDKERGIIIEEWRLGRGAEERMMNKQYPILFKGSKFAERLPIGKKEIIESFKHGLLKKFYHDWYRPELMAVIAVGDFDIPEIEKLITEHFSRLPLFAGIKLSESFPVPDHKETLFAIVSDKEAQASRVFIYHKKEVEPYKILKDFRRNIISSLYDQILSERIREITQKSDPPFSSGFSFGGRLVSTKDFYALGGYYIKDNKIKDCLDILLTENERVKKFGFTESEFQRQKTSFLRNYERDFNERDKTESSGLAEEYVSNFLENKTIMGIENAYNLVNEIVPNITLKEINDLGKDILTNDNTVLLISLPEKEGIKIPSEEELTKTINSISKKDITAYDDQFSNDPLLEKSPTPSPLKSEKLINELGITEWTLGNGVRIVLKPTDFKNDQIMFSSFSPGGTSLANDKDYISAKYSSSVINLGSLGKFSRTQLQKYLTGKIVYVSPFITDWNELMWGGCSPKDIETMFQMIYLYFTTLTKDSTGFLNLKSQMRSYLDNLKESPENAFEDTLNVTLYNYHPRRKPTTMETINEIDFKTVQEIYRDRFADASDFTFFFIGKFDPKEIKPLIEKYLGGLPNINRKEKFKDDGSKYVKGIKNKIVYKGIEPKASVKVVFSGEFEYNIENRFLIDVLAEVLTIKLREVIREEKSGTYGISVSASAGKYPIPQYTFNFNFSTSPDRYKELTDEVFKQLDSIKYFGIAESYINKVKELKKRARETELKQNEFWLMNLSAKYQDDEDPLTILFYNKLVDSLTKEKIIATAKKYLDMNNYIKIVLLPEKK